MSDDPLELVPLAVTLGPLILGDDMTEAKMKQKKSDDARSAQQPITEPLTPKDVLKSQLASDLTRDVAPTSEAEQGSHFTGIARSIETFYNNNKFTDFRIVTLHIVKGKIIKTEYSDPYGAFEVGIRLDLANDRSFIHLNNNWSIGRAFSK